MDSDTAAFLIQRAWRRYRCNGGGRWPSEQESAAEEEVAQRTLATSGYMTTSISSCFSDMRTSNSFSDWRVSASNTEDNLGGAAVNGAAVGAAEPATPMRCRRLEQLKEADSLSIMSDCSELMGEVGKLLKEQLASQDALLRPRVHLTGSRSAVFQQPPPPPQQQRQSRQQPPTPVTHLPAAQRGRSLGRGEVAAGAAAGAAAAAADEDARREQRKANFLSLAQEFAELKRRNADALPFNLHRLGRGCSPPVSSASPAPSSSTTGSSESPPGDGEEDADDEGGLLYQLVPVSLTDSGGQLQPRRLRREERLRGLFCPSQPSRPPTEPQSGVAEAVTLRRGPGVLSERERVLQALSMSAEDEDSGLASAGILLGGGAACIVGGQTQSSSATLLSASSSLSSAAGAASAAASAGAVSAAGGPRRLSGGMEMCFRNDAASDTECSDSAPPPPQLPPPPPPATAERQRQQRHSRTAKSCAVPKVSEAAAPMQLCFISDLTSDEEDSASANSSTLVSDSGIGDPFKSESRSRQQQLEAGSLAESQCTTATTATSSSLTAVASIAASVVSTASGQDADCAGGDNEDLLARQARLQAEAQLALAQARPMAKMQLEVERHEQRSRASRDVVAELIGVSSAAARRFHRAHLQQLSVGALQLIYNDLLCRIESHNEELVRSLIERDDLHMEQDSMLVEIEDLTRRAQEVANRLQEAPPQQHPQAAAAATAAAAAATGAKAAAASPVRRKMSSITSRLKPNKLVSLFTGGN